jgi:RNA polymerase sigma-70 factor (ECF subfamily)
MSEQPAFQDDLDLANRARKGDPRARERIAKRFRCIPGILGSRNAKLGFPLRPEDLDDLVQDVVVAVWKKIGHYRGDAPLEGWIYSFCILEMKSFMRRYLQRESRKEILDETSPPSSRQGGPGLDYYEDIYIGLERLGAEYSAVIRLKHFHKLTFEEMAKRLEISANTAKTRYYRGLIKLREYLDPRRREEKV